jgi:hypothetical protein
MRSIFFCGTVCAFLVACGGGGGAPGTGSSAAPTIQSSDYTLPTTLPSVPDQADN